MNLLELFEQLRVPLESTKIYNAVPIPDFPHFRIAVNWEGLPVLLLKARNPVKNTHLKNYRLRYLQIEQNAICKITENNKCTSEVFTVITFISFEKNLQEHFFRISEPIIKILGKNPLQQQIMDTVYKFVEIFRSLGDNPTKTTYGLWTELFLIEISNKPKVLLDYWHNLPEEKFDFNSGSERVEVKSNSNFERIHIFSSEQLNTPQGTELLIASIFIRQSNSGLSIYDLIEKITIRIQNEVDLIDKMNSIVCKTLGNSLEQFIKVKYDYMFAKESLLFYNSKDISKIEAINIPNEVYEVRYKSDLTKVTPVKVNTLNNKRDLFSSL